MKLNPLTIKKLRRFKSIKRGYYSFILIFVIILASFFAEVLVNKRAIMVHYNGSYYFPTYGDMIPGTAFGLDYKYETNYRQLAKQFESESKGNTL
jgi:microcin C transport system permease protein